MIDPVGDAARQVAAGLGEGQGDHEGTIFEPLGAVDMLQEVLTGGASARRRTGSDRRGSSEARSGMRRTVSATLPMNRRVFSEAEEEWTRSTCSPRGAVGRIALHAGRLGADGDHLFLSSRASSTSTRAGGCGRHDRPPRGASQTCHHVADGLAHEASVTHTGVGARQWQVFGPRTRHARLLLAVASQA